jgi:hypothetical protein
MHKSKVDEQFADPVTPIQVRQQGCIFHRSFQYQLCGNFGLTMYLDSEQ